MIWELVFMLVVLKIPVVYLCAVVWWAIRSEPGPLEGAGRLAPVASPGPRCDWRRRRALLQRRRPLPRRGGGGRSRLPGRTAYARGRLLA